VLGFTRTDNQALVSCLGDPQRAVAAHHELLRRGQDAVGAIRAGLQDEDPAVREGCCRLLDHLVDTDSMGQLIAMAGDPDPHVRAMAAELVGKFVHTDSRAVTALETARVQDPSPVVRKKAGWFTPGGTIYQRTASRLPR
jgi:HEAT repeat protein